MYGMRRLCRPTVMRAAFPVRASLNHPRAFWFSSEAKKDETGEKAAETAPKPEENAQLKEIQEKYEAKSKEIAELKDNVRHKLADARNMENRVKRDMEQTRAFAIQKLLKDLLDSVDNLERALSIVPAEKRKDRDSNKDLVDLYDGLVMTESNMIKMLQKHGVVRYDGIGEQFDPNIHEAVFQIPIEGKDANTIFHCESKGYTLNGRVVRPAKVGIVKGEDN
ncbi:mitochondrial [2Fe-2S] cluster assembly and protein import chaperone Mge1 [Schizosaccharomyces osmophilus]|uniref:GrpE protein homolog n=1 Tax=Schizosaccharomyces osmophilus TaxID=2545709 RepID=A0AAF0AUI0_9SCHI|nr:mitochondrial [2Fe-2S] cluster assembly and protein import chaperone Mge1 [Schizosaccharomyces osmophilus]WBW70879.1 mitochondrial [2Fe-2S] cluster assembly and protein import chaperone Mge1 [Schizosaccharomyces osmophilus]